MPQFLASTATGLVDALEKELIDLGFSGTKKIASGVFFDSNWEGVYRANLQSRLASRIGKPILDFPAYTGEDLYHNIMKHDFTKYIDVKQTFKIEATVLDGAMKDQRFVAMKVKDAIADQFRDATGGERPDVDNFNPDLRIYIKGVKNRFHVHIDTSGESLFMRGYRKEAGPAPMKENLAAGLIMLAEWDKKTPIVDPMCGSGTLLIEAAMMAMNIAPGSHRKEYGFMKLKGFDKKIWEKVVMDAADQEQEIDFKFYGADLDRKVLQAAKENARRAGVDHVVEFKSESIATYAPPVEKGLMITNPPYGARLGEEDMLKDVYRDLGHTLKHRFKGWDAWILSGNKDLILDMRLKATRKHFVYNGPLECRYLKYSMF